MLDGSRLSNKYFRARSIAANCAFIIFFCALALIAAPAIWPTKPKISPIELPVLSQLLLKTFRNFHIPDPSIQPTERFGPIAGTVTDHDSHAAVKLCPVLEFHEQLHGLATRPFVRKC